MLNNTVENGQGFRIRRLAENAAILSVGEAHVSVVDGWVTPLSGLPIVNLNTGERRGPLIPMRSRLSADPVPTPSAAIGKPGLQLLKEVFKAG